MSEETEEQPSDDKQQPEKQTWNESSAGENIIAADAPAKEDNEQQNKNMETHAQHLHHAPGKKFRHYIYEFLMLFLAVFCGFIAENWREHFIERKKEKEYMHSMVTDLQKDTALLKRASVWLGAILAATDTTITLLNHEILNDSIIKEVYRLDNQAFRFVNAELDDRTTAQLKNAGGMRLILNKRVLDGLADYWNFQKTLNWIKDNLAIQKTKTHDVGLRILSQKYFSESNRPLQLTVTGKPQFIRGWEILLPEYLNRLVLCREVTKNYLKFMKGQSDLAIDLMNLIKKEYHL